MDVIEASVIEGKALSPRYRQRQLFNLHETINQSLDKILRAIQSDTGCSSTDAHITFYLTTAAVKTFYESLDVHVILKDEYSIAKSIDNPSRRTPHGCAYIIPSSNDLFYSTVVGTAAAITGGNCVVVEIQRTLSEVSGLLVDLLSSTLGSDTFKVVQSRVSEEFLKRHSIILDAGASEDVVPSYKTLSPSTGRVVAVVDRTANVRQAANQIVNARLRFSGRSPYAPDLVLVDEFCLKDFANAVGKQVLELTSANVDEDNVRRKQRSMADDERISNDQLSSGKVTTLLSGSDGTVAIIHDRQSPLLKRKISQPLLLIHPTTSMDDAIDFANSSTDSPNRALYTFCSPAGSKYIMQFIDARLACANHIPVEILVGPPAPVSHAPSIQPRYLPEMFTNPSPQFAKPSADSTELSNTLENRQKKSSASLSKLQTKVKPMDESPGGAINFFEQGLMIGAGAVLTSIVALSVSGIWYWRSSR